MRGLYVVFEGNDGAGKSTTMKAVAEALPKKLGRQIDLELTNHPGSTPLGKHLRQLVKYPETIDPEIKIDSLSRQILYMVDTVSFIKQKLQPALASGRTIFADRSSFISALVYGTAEGLNLADIDRLFQLITPPKMDRLYVLRCPWQVGKQRLDTRGNPDHFERKPSEFFRKVEEAYDRLVTGPEERTLLVSRSVSPKNIVYVDSILPLDRVVDTITTDLVNVIRDLAVSSSEEE
jgi:dTMP kinase